MDLPFSKDLEMVLTPGGKGREESKSFDGKHNMGVAKYLFP